MHAVLGPVSTYLRPVRTSHPLPHRALLLVAGLSVTLGLSAQSKPKTKVVLYKDRLNAAFDTVNCVKNVIKINAFSFLRGEFPVYYERAITHDVSVEIAAGITFRNYIPLTMFGDEVDDFSAGTEIKIGPSFHAGFRYYFLDDIEPQGGYLQLGFSYLQYIKDIRPKDVNGEITDVRYRDTQTFNDIRLVYGYQLLSARSNWLFDFYGGVGMRDKQATNVIENYDVTTNVWSYEIKEIDEVVPAIFLGAKVGVGF